MAAAASHDQRLARARISLEGLSIGDSFGCYGNPSGRRQPAPWPYTDDTNMALSIYAMLRQQGSVEQDALAMDFAAHFDIRRAYGPGARRLLTRILGGVPWRQASRELFSGQGSYGNGAAMRVAPLGAYFADDLEAVVEQARISAEVTHAHPEGIAAAIAVAIAAAYTWRLHNSEPPSRKEFTDLILPHVPDSEVCEKIRHARDLAPSASVNLAVAALGNGSEVSAQDTVPFVLWCAGEQLGDYAEALRLTVSGGGNSDTTCAMVGGIVALYTGMEGIPQSWLASREPLPEWALGESNTSL